MNGAIVISWGAPVRGREMKGLDVFSHALQYYETLAKQGRIHGHHEYFSLTGNTGRFAGFMLVTGALDDLMKIQIEEEAMRLQADASQIVENFSVNVFSGGSDASIQQSVTRYTESLASLGYL